MGLLASNAPARPNRATPSPARQINPAFMQPRATPRSLMRDAGMIHSRRQPVEILLKSKMVSQFDIRDHEATGDPGVFISTS
jgi:hypothetical protein